MKIITTTFKSWKDTGVYKVLKNLEILSRSGQGLNIQFKFKEDLSQEECDLVISCGLGLDVLKSFFGKARKAVLYCSNFLQAYLASSSNQFTLGDLEALGDYLSLLKNGSLDYIFTTSSDIPQVLGHPKILFFPPVLEQEHPYPVNYQERSGIYSIGSTFKHRNLPTLFSAYKYASPPEKLVVNGHEYNGLIDKFSSLLPTLKENIEMISRLDTNSFLEKMSRAIVGVQLSLSETFSLSTYEFCKMRVPVIISPAIRWLRGTMIDQYLRVQNLDDPIEIGERINLIVEAYHVNREKGLYPILIQECVLSAQQVERENYYHVTGLLKGLEKEILG